MQRGHQDPMGQCGLQLKPALVQVSDKYGPGCPCDNALSFNTLQQEYVTTTSGASYSQASTKKKTLTTACTASSGDADDSDNVLNIESSQFIQPVRPHQATPTTPTTT